MFPLFFMPAARAMPDGQNMSISELKREVDDEDPEAIPEWNA